MEYIRREMEKIGIADYERQNRELALRLFDGESITEEQQEMLDYISAGSAYGNKEILAENGIASKGKLRYYLSRLFPPYYWMLEKYPILRKVPVLYPFAWVHRLLRACFTGRSGVVDELKPLFGARQKGK